ncbi:MAG: Trp biosynthesis-associated membrane protein [Actinomycetota bacterium]
MSHEALSTARPTPLRLAGFLCLAAGAVAAGVGATREWAAVGFSGDALGAADVSVRGTDVWEGKVVLFGAGVALVAMLAMRMSASGATRRWLALLILALGIACTVLPVLDAVRAEDRFGGREGIDRLASAIAVETGQEVETVRDVLLEQLERSLRVEVGPGAWLAAGGGVLLLVGGALGLVWARRGPATGPPVPDQGASGA